MYNIKPRRVIIVGGASGIGYETASLLLKNNVEQVVICSRNENKLKAARERLLLCKTNHQNVHIIPFDITECFSHEDLFIKAKEACGLECDGLVISSGVNFNGSNWRGFNISEEDYDSVMNTNLKGPFFLIRNFSNHLINNNIKGNICVISSISAHRDLLSVYQISKNALSGIVSAYGKHLYQKGIILNAVEPGTVSTDMQSKEFTDGVRPGKAWNDNALGRMIRSEEIAKIVCFLMSDIGEVMTGTCLLASGGCKTIIR